ncbi:hypothetical protein AB1N83_003121 [Pleurotus pulmonarius]
MTRSATYMGGRTTELDHEVHEISIPHHLRISQKSTVRWFGDRNKSRSLARSLISLSWMPLHLRSISFILHSYPILLVRREPTPASVRPSALHLSAVSTCRELALYIRSDHHPPDGHITRCSV